MKISHYKVIKVIKETQDKKIELIENEIDHLYYIKRTLSSYSLEMYEKLLQIRHPLLITPIFIEEVNNKLITFEKYINAPTLDYLLINHEFDHSIEKIMNDIISALKCLHKYHIIHRDIKPENILCDEHAYLFDFDIAKVYHDSFTHDTKILGSVGYAAPEQFGFMQSNEKSDIYALGKLLETLCAYTHTKTYSHVIEKATQFNPEKRYRSLDRFLKDISRPQMNGCQLPGFRTHTKSHEIIMGCMYGCLILIILFGVSDGDTWGSVADITAKVILSYIFFSTLFILSDYRQINRYLINYQTQSKISEYVKRIINLILVQLISFIIISYIIEKFHL